MNSADSVEHLERSEAGMGTAQLIAFPGIRGVRGARTTSRFSMRDRIMALDWSDAVRPLGFTKLVFEDAGDFGDNETGEFVLIYEKCASWASWGIGYGERGMTLWRSACGTTMGQYATLGEALSALQTFTQKA